MTANPILTNVLRIFDLAESMEPDARDKAYRECHRLIRSLESGDKSYMDAEIGDSDPLTAEQEIDSELLSAALAISYARLIRVHQVPHFHNVARLRILALMGDDAADAERETREQNAAAIAWVELGLDPLPEGRE